MAFTEDFPTPVLPEVLRDTSNQPEPTPFLFGGDLLIPESSQSLFEHRRAGFAPLRRQESETVEKVDLGRGPLLPAAGPGLATNATSTRSASRAATPHQDRGGQGIEIVSRANPTSSGSSRRAAIRSSGGTLFPGLKTAAIWPRSKSTHARCDASGGPVSAKARRVNAASGAPASCFACAAARARLARKAGS